MVMATPPTKGALLFEVAELRDQAERLPVETYLIRSNLGPPPVVPVATTVPTLVLAGQFDPVAGSALSRQVADEIGAHALWVEFPRLDHPVPA
jgi:pimeloyl-ACP methyl ester carboxylesterase